MRFLVLCTLLLIGINLKADLPSVCFVKNSSVVKNMPPVRNQGHTPFCYGFAATQTLQHFVCTQNKTAPCKNEISVLDVIKKGNGGKLAYGGFSDDILGQIKNRTLTTEACAPFKVIGEKKDPQIFFPQWKKTFNKAFEDSQKCDCSYEERLKNANNLKKLMDLQSSAEEIVAALRMKEAESALAQILIPIKCNQEQIDIPPFEFNKQQVTDKYSIRNLVSEKMAQQKPLIATLCANRINETDSPCNHHALVITGTREVCCEKGCHTEYRLHDSDPLYVTHKIAEEYWSKEDDFYLRVSKQTKKEGSGNVYFVWIDKRP